MSCVSAISHFLLRRLGTGGLDDIQAEGLQDEETEIHRIDEQIAAPKSPRFFEQAERPFEAPALHGAGRLWQMAGVEVEGSPDRQGGHREGFAHLVNENFLLRAA